MHIFLSIKINICFTVCTGCGDTIARMYEAKSGTLKRTFKGHENAIVCVEVKLTYIFQKSKKKITNTNFFYIKFPFSF